MHDLSNSFLWETFTTSFYLFESWGLIFILSQNIAYVGRLNSVPYSASINLLQILDDSPNSSYMPTFCSKKMCAYIKPNFCSKYNSRSKSQLCQYNLPKLNVFAYMKLNSVDRTFYMTQPLLYQTSHYTIPNYKIVRTHKTCRYIKTT